MGVSRPSNARALRLRQRQTDVERRLWFALRDRRLRGAKFRRQAPMGPYIVDFVCLQAALIVELDGGQHGGDEDQARQAWLEAQGYHVLRFWNNEVTTNFDGVLSTISARLQKPSPAGGRGLGEGGPPSRLETTLAPSLARQREREKRELAP
ncbi:MAG TPA: endonuclease domain-containing protein [Acetobacteraceae bacterium]|nr:endonuclease domain-containing protein [Acetobacteraceae bacterium]